MKVLQVFKDYYPPTRGGIEQHVNTIVHHLEGFEFAVLTSSRSRRMVVDDDEGVRVIRAPEYARPTSTPITTAWSRLLRESGADLLHFHMPNPFGELAFLTSRSKAPMVATYHADIVGRGAILPLFLPLQQRFLRSARKVIVSNPRLLETSSSLSRHRDRAVVIPFGVDVEKFEARSAKADLIRERHPGPLLLFVGRLAYYKGLDVVIDAMRGIEATLLIVGDGPLRVELETAALAKGVAHKVFFVGEITDEDRTAHYHAADLFVLPSTSRAEAFGISMLEAMACGTPAISTELGTGTSWVNQNGETGIVVSCGSPGELGGAIKALLRDDVRRKEMGEAAALRVREHFTLGNMLKNLAEVYSSI